MASSRQTLQLAHTAECKLRLAANRPDRNLRFLLGHAFTLDKLNLILLETEEEQDVVNTAYAQSQRPVPGGERRVSFADIHGHDAEDRGRSHEKKRSPPPSAAPAYGEESDEELSSSSDDYDEDDLDPDDGGGLTRFESASAMPPRTLADIEESSSAPKDLDGASSIFSSYSEDEMRDIMSGNADEDLTELFKSVADCRCHDQQVPAVSGIWRLPEPELTPQHKVPRRAVMVV